MEISELRNGLFPRKLRNEYSSLEFLVKIFFLEKSPFNQLNFQMNLKLTSKRKFPFYYTKSPLNSFFAEKEGALTVFTL